MSWSGPGHPRCRYSTTPSRRPHPLPRRTHAELKITGLVDSIDWLAAAKTPLTGVPYGPELTDRSPLYDLLPAGGGLTKLRQGHVLAVVPCTAFSHVRH